MRCDAIARCLLPLNEFLQLRDGGILPRALLLHATQHRGKARVALEHVDQHGQVGRLGGDREGGDREAQGPRDGFHGGDLVRIELRPLLLQMLGGQQVGKRPGCLGRRRRRLLLLLLCRRGCGYCCSVHNLVPAAAAAA